MFNFNKNESNNIWKKKALERRKKNKELEKRIIELTTSRDFWKRKSEQYKELNNNLYKELKKNDF